MATKNQKIQKLKLRLKKINMKNEQLRKTGLQQTDRAEFMRRQRLLDNQSFRAENKLAELGVR